MNTRSGIGFDVHPLVEGRALVLGGVTVPFNRGLSGHSDGDVLTHSIIDALLGGAGLGDIGTYFPSECSIYEGAASTELLQQTVQMLSERGWQLTYLDATILAERPLLRPFISQMIESLAHSLSTNHDSVNLKVTTTDGLGSIGRGEGIAVMAIATMEQAK